jgi:hypothetical protein
MHTNDANNAKADNKGLLYKDLSYAIVGILISVHNELGPYAREKNMEM